MSASLLPIPGPPRREREGRTRFRAELGVDASAMGTATWRCAVLGLATRGRIESEQAWKRLL